MGEVVTSDNKVTSITDIVRPSDNVKVTVLRGQNLEKQKFGKPDPYVVLSYGEQVEKSKVVKGNLSPEWNLEKVFNVTAKSPKEILLEVYDKDTVTKDDFMGRVSVLISDIPKLRQGTWIPLQDCKSGEVFLSGEIISSTSNMPAVSAAQPKSAEEAKIIPLTETEKEIFMVDKAPTVVNVQESEPKGEKEAKDKMIKVEQDSKIAKDDKLPVKQKSDNVKTSHAEYSKDKLIFILHAAKKLANKDSLGKSDPYAVISFGSQVSRTETISNNLIKII